MKIGIVTHYQVHNHGALLQLYGLKKILEKNGHSVDVLSFKKNFDFMGIEADKKYNISLKSLPFYFTYLIKKGIARTVFNIGKYKKLNGFRDENSLVGSFYSRAENLDAVFIGSDEVFSIEAGLTPVFWGLGIPCNYIFSYAGCFGPTTIDFIKEKYAEEFIRAGIERIRKISVRDKNSQDIIENLSNSKVPIVCDPVILYGFNEEIKSFKSPIKEKYMFIYAYDNNMNDVDEVKNIVAYARSQGLIIVCAGFFHKWCDKNINVSPLELLQYISGAECVVTDTFHGTVISIITNRPFVTKIRGNRNKLGFLLEEYGLSDREVINFNNLTDVFNQKIDFENVNSKVREKRDKSMRFLLSCLEQANNDK